MSWLCSQALVEASLGEKYLDGKLYAQLKLKNTLPVYYCSDKMTVHFTLSQYGKTLGRSLKETTIVGDSSNTYKASMISWLFPEASHAKIYQWLAKVQASAGNAAAYGERCGGWFAKYDREKSMWRTAQCSLLGELMLYSGSFPKWGMMRFGVCWELMTLEPITSGNEYGYLPGVMIPTPTKSDATVGGVIGKNDMFKETSNGALRKINQNGTDGSLGLARMVQFFPTPIKSDFKRNGPNSKQQNLASTVTKYPTPCLPGNGGSSGKKKMKQLLFPTDGTRGGTITKNMTGTSLPQFINTSNTYPTPTASMYKGASEGAMVRQNGKSRENDRLDFKMFNREGQLNPDWVELLMMWPMNWTRLEEQRIDVQNWIRNYSIKAHADGTWQKGVAPITPEKHCRIHRLKGLGNGQVPWCHAAAFVLLHNIHNSIKKIAAKNV